MGSTYKYIKTNGKKEAQHRIVAEKKIGRKLRAGEVVHHINGIKDDNRPENLEVMTLAEHSRMHMIGNSHKTVSEDQKHSYHMRFRGEGSTRVHLTNDDVSVIKGVVGRGMTNQFLGDLFGVHRGTISKISRGVCWGHIEPMPFERAYAVVGELQRALSYTDLG